MPKHWLPIDGTSLRTVDHIALSASLGLLAYILLLTYVELHYYESIYRLKRSGQPMRVTAQAGQLSGPRRNRRGTNSRRKYA